MTLEEAVLKVLEQGEGNPTEIAMRLVPRVRALLNKLVAEDTIKFDKVFGANEHRYHLPVRFPELPETSTLKGRP